MKRRIGPLLVALLGVCVLGLVVCLALLLRPPRSAPLPQPNGYNDFMKAGQALASRGNISDATNRDQLQAIISANAAALDLIRTGLSHECRFPANEFLTNAGANLQMLASMKGLAQLLAANGRLAEFEGRTNDAIASYVEVIQFGNETSRGGWVINRLVGIACEAIGQAPLIRLTPELSPEQLHHLVGDLEAIDARHVSWDEIRRNERIYMRHNFLEHPNPLVLVTLWPTRAAIQKARTRDQHICTKLRLLIAELAVQAYRLENGQPPARLDQLVPGYMKSVPQDPFSGRPLAYRQQGTDWLLYSVGPDGVDNGGVRQTNRGVAKPGADMFFDSP